MLYITVPDENDSIGRIELNKKQYYIRFTWNTYGGYWSFGLYDANMNPLIPMTRMVENYMPLFYFTYTDFPDGEFGVVCDETIGRDSFNDGTATFVFFPREELEDYGYYDQLEQTV